MKILFCVLQDKYKKLLQRLNFIFKNYQMPFTLGKKTVTVSVQTDIQTECTSLF